MTDEKELWVEVTQAESPRFWYADKIGQRFNVSHTMSNCYGVVSRQTTTRIIDKSDCKIVSGPHPEKEETVIERIAEYQRQIEDNWRRIHAIMEESGIEKETEGLKTAEEMLKEIMGKTMWKLSGKNDKNNQIEFAKKYALSIALAVRKECAEKAKAKAVYDKHGINIESVEVDRDSIMGVDVERLIK